MGKRSAAATPPNIILMIADNLGWKDLGCCGNTDVKTPFIDRMAKEGVLFSNAFVTAPSCSPSRASIISGQAPHSVNVMGLTHLYPQYQMPLNVPTLPRLLREAGYRTAINGKWHVTPYRPVRTYGYQSHMGTFSIKSSEPARDFISANRNNPFYLEMNFMQTHRPALPGQSHAYHQHPDFPVDPESIAVPGYYGLPDWPEIREDLAGYYSQAAWMDALIGEVQDHLEGEGLAENTLVVLVSDNGPMYPGGIGACHDFGIGTPLIIRWPERLPANRTEPALASTIDIMPTCLEAAGIPAPPEIQGKSLLSLAGEESSGVQQAVYAEMTYHVRYTVMRAVRTREYKYIENLNREPVGLDMCKKFEWAKRAASLPGQKCCSPRPPRELYDLRSDPCERENLAGDPGHASIERDLKEKLDRWRQETRDPLLQDR